jgi:hypothetical protein
MKKGTMKKLTKQKRKARGQRKTDVKRKVSRTLRKTQNRQQAMKVKKQSLTDIVVSENEV